MAFNYTRKNPYEYDSVKEAKRNLDNVGKFEYSDQTKKLQKQRDENLLLKPEEWNNEKESQGKNEAYDAWKNRGKFSFDLNGDALYQQYKNTYMNQGKLAMKDAIGQASALTGGYGNSYAASVGNQAYQASLQKLNDIVPELYQMAYQMYQQEGDDLKYAYDVARDEYNTKYGEWMNSNTLWQADQNRLDTNTYNSEALDFTKYSDERDYNTNVYNNALTFAANDSNTDWSTQFDAYKQGVQEDQWSKEYKLQQDKLAETIRSNVQSETKDNVKPKKTSNATNFAKSILDKKWWGTGMTYGDEKKYGSYDEYVSAKILKGIYNGEISESEAKYLLESVYKIDL